ncbi:MAG TPA: flagellar hook-length control protein FliK [Feifaniaceae bacterium]|nr:flagellar hook-length control protein FliK [Feifaniaceae bacterium]
MNAVHNVTLELPVAAPAGRAPSKPFISFRDIRENILKEQAAKNASAKPKTKSEETAAEQGMAAMAAAVKADTAANAVTKDTQAADALQQELSKCCDFTELTGKIADILEGFGLLKSNGGTAELTEEGKTFLQNMMDAIMNAENSPESVMPAVAGNEAGMLNTAIPEDVQQELQLLIKEYVCSLENADNTGGAAADTDSLLPAGTDPAAQTNIAISASGSGNIDPKLNNDTENADKDNSGIISAAGEAQEEEAVKTGGLLSKAAAGAETETESKPVVLQEGEDAQAGAAGQKDPLAQLMQALMAVKKGGNPEAPVQPYTPGPEFMQNAQADIPFPVVTQTEMAENISSIVERMSFRSADNVQEFSVSLKPEHLGELSIKLAKGPEGLLAQIKAADPSTRGLIQNEVAALTEQLKEKGIEIRQIEVLYEAPAFTTDPHQNEGRHEAAASPYKARYYRTSGIEETYGMADPAAPPALLSPDSSVEYQA